MLPYSFLLLTNVLIIKSCIPRDKKRDKNQLYFSQFPGFDASLLCTHGTEILIFRESLRDWVFEISQFFTGTETAFRLE